MRLLILCMLLGCGRLHFADLGDGGGTGDDDGAMIDAPPPSSCITRIAAGHTHACAIKDAASYCWGTGTGGELGDGMAITARKVPTPVRAFGSSTFIDAGVGGHWGCWLLPGGNSVQCTGKNNHGQLGRGTMTGFETVAAPVNGLPPVVDLVVGAQHACAREANGQMWCWGCQEYALNADCVTFALNPSVIASNVSLLPPGHRRGGCYKAGGTLRCWGANEDGGLGNGASGTTVVSINAVPILFNETNQVAHGRRHACGLNGFGEVACWGANNVSQLGRGPTGPASDPVPAIISLPTTVIDLVAGSDHTCALTSDGDVWCWGSNSGGQLGVGDMINRDVPTRVPIDGVAAIGAYGFGTCAARVDGMYCWGSNTNALLANGVVGGGDVPSPALSQLTCP